MIFRIASRSSVIKPNSGLASTLDNRFQYIYAAYCGSVISYEAVVLIQLATKYVFNFVPLIVFATGSMNKLVPLAQCPENQR